MSEAKLLLNSVKILERSFFDIFEEKIFCSVILVFILQKFILSHYLKNHPKAMKNITENEKSRYSDEELKEFEELLNKKLAQAKEELQELKETLSKRNDSGTDETTSNSKVLEDGSDTLERENINQLAARQQKFIHQLENALIRIKNGTYGICIDTNKLIPKERLRLVPHTQHSIEAKMKKQ